MSVVSKPGKCPSSSTRDAALDLLLSLQHPYIYPVLDLAFTTDNQGQAYVLTIIPYNEKGSLKDLIYKVVSIDFLAVTIVYLNVVQVSTVTEFR